MKVGDVIIKRENPKLGPQSEEFCAEVEPGRWVCIHAHTTKLKSDPSTRLDVMYATEHEVDERSS